MTKMSAAQNNETSRNLAENLLELRRSRKLTQGSLARLSGLPRSTVTLLESGSANPSLSTLLQVARVLQVGIEELLQKKRADVVHVKAADVPVHRRSKAGVLLRKLLPDSIPAMEIDGLELEGGAQMVGTPHVEGTKEYLVCVEGRMSVRLRNANYDIETGDVLAFPGNAAHTYANPHKTSARAISVVVLASYA